MSEHQVTDVRPPTPEEERLTTWFAEQHLKSPDNLEAAARQVVGLVTGLVGLLFTVVAVAEKPLPTYLARPVVRGLAAGSVLFLLLALVAGLLVLWPRRWTVSAHRLDLQREAFEAILAHKARWLGVSLVLFFLGVGALAGVSVSAIFLAR